MPNSVVETEISIIPLAFVENGRCESVRFHEGETSRRKPRFIENFENGNAEAREQTEGEKEDVERDAAKPRGPCKVRKGERENKFSGSLQVILLPARRSRNIG